MKRDLLNRYRVAEEPRSQRDVAIYGITFESYPFHFDRQQFGRASLARKANSIIKSNDLETGNLKNPLFNRNC